MATVFRGARFKLTYQYLAIIMAISIFFSVIIYQGATFELRRIEKAQRLRRPAGIGAIIDPEVIQESKNRIANSLLVLNLFILCSSALSGYYLAGKTLSPIERMIEEQKNFVSNASHELKTPLASLRTEIEVGLRDKKLNLKKAKDLLKSNLEDVEKINSLSNFLLKLDKYQNGGNNFKLKKTSLKRISETAISSVSSLAKVRRIKIVAELQETFIKGNRRSLEELVTIFLDNAIKYSKTGGKIIVKTKNKQLSVQDFGRGIAKKDIPHLYDRFFGEGSGLGLSIAKNIVKLHKGNIRVKSEVGKGSTFKVNFS